MNGYDLALEVTDEAFGQGTYAEMHKGNPNPAIQAAIRRAEGEGAGRDVPQSQPMSARGVRGKPAAAPSPSVQRAAPVPRNPTGWFCSKCGSIARSGSVCCRKLSGEPYRLVSYAELDR